MDYRGVVVASTRADLGKALTGQEEVRKALQGRHVSLLRQRYPEETARPMGSISRSSRVRVSVAMPVIEGDRVLGAVLLSRTPMALSTALHRNRFYLVGGGAVILFVVCAVTVLTTLLITRPVKALIRQAEQVALSDKEAVAVPLSRPGTYEVDHLSKALAQMSGALEKRANYIRTFASNVSHEFKTPLTSIRGVVELLKEHLADMSEANRARFLNILEQDADRLARLVQRLLDLARADVLKPGSEQTHPADSFKQVAERFQSESLSVTFDLAPGIQPIAMAPEVFESVLSNLVDNAGQHAGDEAHVHLSARPAGRDRADRVEIDVQDDGRGVSETDADRIFTPFFTTERESGGTGLGLSIVQAIVSAHRGTITLEKSASGALFRLVLPVSREEAGQKKRN